MAKNDLAYQASEKSRLAEVEEVALYLKIQPQKSNLIFLAIKTNLYLNGELTNNTISILNDRSQVKPIAAKD